MLLERKQLAHELQLARLDLSQRKLELERLEAHHSEQLDALREQMQDAVFQRDAVRAQLEAEIAVLREDARRRQVQSLLEYSYCDASSSVAFVCLYIRVFSSFYSTPYVRV